MTEKTTDDAVDKLWSMVEEIGVAMLTTIDDGLLRSRPMQASAEREANCLWFFIKKDQPKEDEVKAAPLVNLSFVDKEAGHYVSLSGHASISNDRGKAQELWSAKVAAWYEDGLNDADLRLLRVDLIQAEYWDQTAGSMRTLYELAKGIVTDENPDLGDNRKISL